MLYHGRAENGDSNTVEVHYVPATKHIVARIVILGRLNRWVVLSNQYEGPNQMLFVAEPTLNGILNPILLTFSNTFPKTVEVKNSLQPDDFVLELVKKLDKGPIVVSEDNYRKIL